MRVGVISNLVTDAGPQPEPSSVSQLGFQVARETEEDMPPASAGKNSAAHLVNLNECREWWERTRPDR